MIFCSFFFNEPLVEEVITLELFTSASLVNGLLRVKWTAIIKLLTLLIMNFSRIEVARRSTSNCTDSRVKPCMGKVNLLFSPLPYRGECLPHLEKEDVVDFLLLFRNVGPLEKDSLKRIVDLMCNVTVRESLHDADDFGLKLRYISSRTGAVLYRPVV